jgi:IPT/TIG domain
MRRQEIQVNLTASGIAVPFGRRHVVISAGAANAGVSVFDNTPARCNFTPSLQVIVAPKITDISPAQWLVGDQVQVTINGQGFDSTSTVNSDSGVTGTIQSVTSTQIIATLSIPADDPRGNTNIYVTAQAQQSGNLAFYKQVPSNSSVISTRALPAGTRYGLDGCSPGDFGIEIDIVYQVLDQQSPAQPIKSAKMRPKEKDLALVINGVSDGDQLPNWGDVVGGSSQITPEGHIPMQTERSRTLPTASVKFRVHRHVESATPRHCERRTNVFRDPDKLHNCEFHGSQYRYNSKWFGRHQCPRSS